MRQKEIVRGFFFVISLLLVMTATGVSAGATSSNKQCESAAMYVEEGNKLVQSEPAKAEALYREALSKCPESVNTSYNLAMALYNQGKSSKSVEVLKNVLNTVPDHKDAMTLLAYILVNENIDTSKGKMLAEKMLDLNPKDEGAKKILMLALTKGITSTPVTASATPSIKAYKEKEITHDYEGSSDVDTDIPNTRVKNPDAIAVVIGNKDYEDKDIPSVDFAVNDAEVVKKYLINVLGYKEGNIIFVANASKGKFEDIFGTREDFKGRLFNYIKPGKSEVFIYYAGHGAPDPKTKQGYFAPADVSHTKVTNGYSLNLLYDNIAKVVKEKNVPGVTIVIDACFSGASQAGPLLKNVSPIGVVVDNPMLSVKNAVVMTSASGTEYSTWYPEKGHSMFTYFFLKALKDGAERDDQNKLTAGDIFNQIKDESEGVPYYASRIQENQQTPQIMGDVTRVLLRK